MFLHWDLQKGTGSLSPKNSQHFREFSGLSWPVLIGVEKEG
jgi:hypothetical protein